MSEAEKPRDYVCWTRDLNPGAYGDSGTAKVVRAFTADDAITQLNLELSQSNTRKLISRCEPYEEERHKNLPGVCPSPGRSRWDPT